MRRCDCGNAAPGPFVRGMCRLCWLAINDPRYAARWGGEEPVARHATQSVRGNLPCTMLGDTLMILDKKRYGLPLARTYSLCTHPTLPNKGREFVCPCDGCGPKCDGYKVPQPEPPL